MIIFGSIGAATGCIGDNEDENGSEDPQTDGDPGTQTEESEPRGESNNRGSDAESTSGEDEQITDEQGNEEESKISQEEPVEVVRGFFNQALSGADVETANRLVHPSSNMVEIDRQDRLALETSTHEVRDILTERERPGKVEIRVRVRQAPISEFVPDEDRGEDIATETEYVVELRPDNEKWYIWNIDDETPGEEDQLRLKDYS